MNVSELSPILSKRVLRRGAYLWRRGGHCLAAIMIVAALLSGGLASAQSNADEAWYERFINSVGKLMFACAWPTDTYDHMDFGHIELKPGGADVSVVLHGKSWLEGPEWTEVVAEIRNGQMKDLRWGKHSSVFFEPGSTIKQWGKFLQQINDELKRQQAQGTHQLPPQPAPQPLSYNRVAAVCLNNPTHDPIVYSVPSDQLAPKAIGPGETWIFSHDGAGDFTVSFNAMKESSIQKTVHLKGIVQASKPSSCDEKMIYEFVVDGQRVGLAPRTWIAGTEHPFTPYLLRGDEGKWVCADGYKWVSADEHDTTCIPANMGLIGVELKIEDGDLFPKILSTRPGFPASRANIPAGSYLRLVDGQSVEGFSIDDVAARTRGPVNTVVRIGIAAPGRDQLQFFDLRRQ